MKQTKIRRAGIVGASLVVALAAVSAVDAAGRVTGRVVDAEGEPVRGLALRLVSTAGGDAAGLTDETNKKGRFGFAVDGSAHYRLEFPAGDVYASSVEIVVKTPAGVTVARETVEGDPVAGLPPLPLSERQETTLTIVVSPLAGEAARERALAFVSPLVNEAAARYEAGELDAALAELEPVLAEHPEVGEAHYLHGLVLRGLARPG